MPSEGQKSSAVRELESLRIARAEAPKRRSRLVPAAITLVVLAILSGIGYEVYLRTIGRPIEVQTAMVTVRSAGQPGVMLTGSGYVVTQHKYISVGTNVVGTIVSEPIEEGQIVKKGDLLARIDDRNYRGLLDQAIADRDLAAANVKLDTAELKRSRALLKEGYLSQDEYDQSENKLAVARASLERAEAGIASQKYFIDQCIITSPINGIVLKKYHEIGDNINYGGQTEAGAGVFDIAQLADTEDMRAEVDINESDIARISIGTPASVIPDSYPDQSYDAKVVKIYPAADRQKGTVKIEVHLLKPDLAIIKPELSVKVTFLAGPPKQQTSPLVVVPKKAVVGEGKDSAVWTVKDDRVTKVPVTLGREFQDGFEVKQGLEGGEMVIVVPPATLQEGQAVTPTAT
jgi:RND family efflux transporter MFP subunit